MTPTALGALPSNAPVPTGARQTKRGVTNGLRNYNNTVAVGTPIYDSTSGTVPMQVQVTPLRDCWWRVDAHSIWDSPDAVWSRIDWKLRLNTPDVLGYQEAVALTRCHGSIGYMPGHCEAVFALAAGVAYTCQMQFNASTNNNQQVYTGPDYLWIVGQTFGEGVR